MKKIIISFLCGIAFVTPSLFAAFTNFPDVKTSDWFYGDVQNMVQWDVIRGNADGTFKPSGYVNRAELAAMWNRYNDYLKTQFEPKGGVTYQTSADDSSVEYTHFDINKKMRCNPEIKQYWNGEVWTEIEPTVWVIYDPIRKETSRCDSAGCDTYGVVTSLDGSSLLIKRPAESGWDILIDAIDANYMERATFLDTSYLSEGTCQNI